MLTLKNMNISDILILALALSLDAMIVSFSYGLIIEKNRIKITSVLAFSFGFFQFIMPLIGWHLTSFIYNYFKIFSKWIVFIIFIYLAFKFLKSAIKEENITKNDCLSPLCILSLAVATSIDALGAGISIKFTYNEILIPSLIIGVITFINSILGFNCALFFKKIPRKYIEIFGSILFIYLAISSII